MYHRHLCKYLFLIVLCSNQRHCLLLYLNASQSQKKVKKQKLINKKIYKQNKLTHAIIFICLFFYVSFFFIKKKYCTLFQFYIFLFVFFIEYSVVKQIVAKHTLYSQNKTLTNATYTHMHTHTHTSAWIIANHINLINHFIS